jgi:hypothetical protein
MTIEQKNIAIAEMLGWRRGHRDFPKEKRWKNDWFDIDEIRRTRDGLEPLLFHSNANWQFEAIDWIEKQKVYIRIEKPIGELSSWFVNFDSEHSEIKEVQVFNKNRKEAIFEALYQFSRYIKNNL